MGTDSIVKRWKMQTVEFLRVQKELKDVIGTCTTCRTVKHPPVPHSGYLRPDLTRFLVLGEAPGPDEFTGGQPFLGRAGRLLRSELGRLETGNNVAFGNTIQCYPGTIRPPSSLEKSNCWKHMVGMVTTLQPDITLLVGNVALQQYWPKLKISEVRGELWKGTPYGTTRHLWFIATWHPSAVLRERQGSKLLKEFRDDLRKFVEMGHDIRLRRDFDEGEVEYDTKQFPRGPVVRNKRMSRRGIKDDGHGHLFDAETEKGFTGEVG